MYLAATVANLTLVLGKIGLSGSTGGGAAGHRVVLNDVRAVVTNAAANFSAVRLGQLLTVHQAAAMVLARRLLGCSERIPRRRVCPVGNGVHIAFTVPVRKRVKHVWTYWARYRGS